ncbi:MAG TPA: hypothetical protein VFF06_16715, partial [Polyangia bacterium]|nr:hypothetical protein [Polyangia bacterium]
MRRWPLGVALVPAIALAAFVWRFGVDVPYWDQWELVPLLKGAHDGTLRAADFFALHNEHRLVVPRLIMLGLAMA